MKRIILLVLVFVAFYGNAVCEDIIYMVTKETILRNQNNQVSSVMTLQKGETVSFQGKISDRKVVPFPQHSLDILVKTKQGNIGWIENENVLLKDYLPLPQSVTKRYWIYSFYQQFVSGAEKEMLFNYEPFWRDEFRKFASTNDLAMSISEWFEWVLPTGFLFIDNYVEIKRLYTQGYISFASISQKQNSSSIELYISCICKNDPHPNQHKLSRNFNEGETYRLTLKIDGDYMDVFLDNEKLVTLIGVDDYFAIAVRDIFRDEKIDMSRITWPRRADGSMDYPAPAGVDLSRTYDEIIFDNETTDNIESHESATAQDSTEKSSMPLPLLLAIIGGVAIAVGVVVVVVLRKKK